MLISEPSAYSLLYEVCSGANARGHDARRVQRGPDYTSDFVSFVPRTRARPGMVYPE